MKQQTLWWLTAATVTTLSHSTYAQERSRATLELNTSRGHLTAGLPRAEATGLRGVWAFAGGDVLNAEILDERKFGQHGGVFALGGNKVLTPDWSLGGTAVLGHGGDVWAKRRFDVELTKAWTAKRNILTRVAGYHASFDGNRSDKGWRLSATAYLEAPVVLEAGVTFNVSEPGKVHSRMPFIAATLGREGQQYLVLRASRGTEAYQAVGAGTQLVDFKSDSISLRWQYWLAPSYGLTVQGERYHNPSYDRTTFGVGGFAQW